MRRGRVKFLTIFIYIFFSISYLIAAETGNFSGKVVDATSGTPLPGANIIAGNDKYIGAATDLRGEFHLTGIPAGEQKVSITYIGYEPKELIISIKKGEVSYHEIQLSPMTLEGETVTVTAQAKGQTEAINQQINSDAITNIVSASKIQELPEANAAEAVGRLPGISLQRQGGEGNKVIIRGLSPQYNSVQIEGINLASTDAGNRSTDLSMMSPDMLSGIEVSKTAMADQDAGQLGGTVNFRIKEAPENPTITILTQGGYNGLREEFGDHKFVIGGSRRFYNNLFGILGNFDYEGRNRSDNSVYANYEMQDSVAIVGSMGLRDVERKRDRIGGTLVLDYKTPSTKIKFLNTYNKSNSEVSSLSELLGPAVSLSPHQYDAVLTESELISMTNSLGFEQYINRLKISGSVNYTMAENNTPDQYSFTAAENQGFGTFSHESLVKLNGRKGQVIDAENDLGYLHPEEFPTVALNNLANTNVQRFFKNESYTKEDQLSAKLDFELDSHVSGFLNINWKFGGKMMHKNKEYDFNSWGHDFQYSPRGWDTVRVKWAEELNGNPALEGYIPLDNLYFPYAPFVDEDYDVSKFMAGDYKIGAVADIDMVKKFMDMVPIYEGGNTSAQGLVTNFAASVPNDYDGEEDYIAAYIMPTMKFGKRLTLIPGFRYEKNSTKYSAHRTGSIGRWMDPISLDTLVTKKRQNEHFLPMIHTRINITDWFDVRASYTQTISRPAYTDIIPRWTLTPSGKALNWNNPDLKPIEAENYDLTLSFYGDKLGLFTVGGFYKKIDNFIYANTTFIADSSMLLAGFPDQVEERWYVTGNINNPNTAKVYGLEVEWQSNFWFLPGIWRGLVLNVNYTYNNSELKYPLTGILYEKTPFGGNKPVGNKDLSFNAPLIDQPDHIFNLTIGFDYKGFSVRSAMQYKSNVFTQNNYYKELRTTTEPLTLYNLSLKQKLPVRGLQAYCNVNNLTSSTEVTTNNGTGWWSEKYFYGMTADIGLRYNF